MTKENGIPKDLTPEHLDQIHTEYEDLCKHAFAQICTKWGLEADEQTANLFIDLAQETALTIMVGLSKSEFGCHHRARAFIQRAKERVQEAVHEGEVGAWIVQ